MSSSPDPSRRRAARAETRRFAARLLLAMALLTVLVGAGAVGLARRHLARLQTREAELRFAVGEAGDLALRRLRAEALADRARVLARRPRLHAALEDDALDLLYHAAHDDLREALAIPAGGDAPGGGGGGGGAGGDALRARFYRFFDAEGRLIEPPPGFEAGPASAEELAGASALAVGLADGSDGSATRGDWVVGEGGERAAELLALPFFSNATGRLLGSLVLGYAFPREDPPAAGGAAGSAAEIVRGHWRAGRLHAPGLPSPVRVAAEAALGPALARTVAPAAELRLRLGGADWLVLHRLVHPSSAPGGARALSFFPLAELARRQREITRRIAGASGVLAALGLLGAGLFTARFTGWFGRLALDSETQSERRAEAESRLERTAAELERAARFSADASHQLKTPVAVLRIGLDELAAAPGFPDERLGDIDELRHQTERLGHIVDDLLLLARLDAGLVRPDSMPVDVATLAAAALDDVSVLPGAATLRLENRLAAPLVARGERGHLILVLQNLLENAAKYNRPGGFVRLEGETDGGLVRLRVGNSAPRPVPPEARERIFERFHRGPGGADTPGHGLGLNLARELARLHGGDLRLLRSDGDSTVFELSLPA